MTIAVAWDVKQQTNQKPTRYPDKGFESSYMKSIMQSFSRQRLTFQKSDAQLHISLQEFKCQQWPVYDYSIISIHQTGYLFCPLYFGTVKEVHPVSV